MYLNLLKEKEKELFIGLAYDFASADGNYSDDEKLIINGYCQEMNISFEKKSMVKPAIDIIREISEDSSKQVKKVFIFELIGLAIVDGYYDENERTLIKQMDDKFQIDAGYANKCEQVISEYVAFQRKINQLVME